MPFRKKKNINPTYAALISALLFLCARTAVYAQSNNIDTGVAMQYIATKIHKKEKTDKKLKRLYGRLYRKAYGKYRAADSIMNSIDSSITAKSQSLDSLSKILQHTIGNNTARAEQLAARITALEAGNGHTALISKKLEALLQSQNGLPIGELQALSKKYYYLQQRAGYWRSKLEDPDEAESEALEYLKGINGFSKWFEDKSVMRPNAATDAATLEAMGFQTKAQVSGMLKEQFGGATDAVQQAMGAAAEKIAAPIDKIKNTYQEVKAGVADASETIANAKTSAKLLQTDLKKGMGKNPMRALPFIARLEYNYTLTTTRAGVDGRPAMALIGVTVLFKHTPKLSYGVGLELNVGLGQDWRNISLTWQGSNVHALADWRLGYGFSAQVGYARTYRPQQGYYYKDKNIRNKDFLENMGLNAENAAYAGIMKRYKINKRWNGTILIGYNFLYRNNGLQTPLILKFGIAK